jgi:GTPase
MCLKVAIVGRSNVGKSSIFNALVNEKLAIIHNSNAVTRDRKHKVITINEKKYEFIDTAGYDILPKEPELATSIKEQLDYVIQYADIFLIVIDIRHGITAADNEYIEYIRKKNLDFMLILNKAEDGYHEKYNLENIYRLAINNYIFISATHSMGIIELMHKLEEYVINKQKKQNIIETTESTSENIIKIAVIGKPNSGKSTFINQIIKNKRLITSNIAGTTRDSTSINFVHKKQKITFVDTAGISRKKINKNNIEKLAITDSYKAIRLANICLLMVDITQQQLDKNEIELANHVINEGRILILILNKVDLVDTREKAKIKEEIIYQINKYGKSIKVGGNNIYLISAISIKSNNSIIDYAIKLHSIWNKKYNTATLNNWLKKTLMKRNDIYSKGRKIKLKYITQTKTRPTRLNIYSNKPSEIDSTIERFLLNNFMNEFKTESVPVRIKFCQSSENPYK